MSGPTYLRGQIFSGGVRLALALALVVGGFHLVFGNNILRTAAYTLGTFGVVTLLAWCMEILLGSSLERVTAERATQYRHEYQPVGGAAFESAQPLLGGPNAPETAPASFFASRGQAFKGRTLDLTLPEESVAVRDPLTAVRNAAAGVVASRTTSGSVPAPAAAPALPSGDQDFQDLSSLLRGAPTPAAVPAAGVAAGSPAGN